MIPIESMMLFVDVVQNSSFAKAAQKNNITAAAVSKRISQLEKIMHMKLLLRSTRKLQLTAPGKALYEKCLQHYSDIQNTYNLILDSQERLQGCIRISAQSSISHLVVAPLIAQLSNKYPDISFEMQIRDARQLPDFGSYDIGIVSGQLHDSSILVRKLAKLPFILCASPVYLKKHGTPDGPHELSKHYCLDYNYRENINTWVFKKNGVEVKATINPKISTNNATFIYDAALQDAGVIYVPNFAVQNEIQSGKLIPILQDYKTIEMPLWLATHLRYEKLPKKVQIVIDAIVKALIPMLHNV